jgi:hypothetical protein
MTSRRRFGRIRQLPSARWQARYPVGSGQDIAAPETFASKGDAARWLVTVEADIARGLFIEGHASSKLTMELCAHVSQDADKDAAMALENRFRPVLSDANGHAAGTEPA